MGRLVDVEKELGHPIDDIIKVMGPQGYSKQYLAKKWDMNYAVLCRVCNERQLRGYFLQQHEMNDECRGGRKNAEGSQSRSAPKDQYDLVSVLCACTTPGCKTMTPADVWQGSKPFKKRCHSCKQMYHDNGMIPEVGCIF